MVVERADLGRFDGVLRAALPITALQVELAALFRKRRQRRGLGPARHHGRPPRIGGRSPFRLTNACSVGLTADLDCVDKRELHRDVRFDLTNEYRNAAHLIEVLAPT